MKLTRISLPVRDPAAFGTFFRDVLELPVSLADRTATVTAGWTLLDLRHDPVARTSHHLAFTIPMGALDSAREWLSTRTSMFRDEQGDVTFRSSPAVDARSLYFDGPEESLLEFIGRAERDDDAGPRFGPDLVRCISEVGIVVDGTVTAAADELQRHSGIAPYKMPPSDTFALVGTTDGLLVLVADGRVWFPTQDRVPTRVRTEIEAAGPRPGRYRVARSCTLTVHPDETSVRTE